MEQRASQPQNPLNLPAAQDTCSLNSELSFPAPDNNHIQTVSIQVYSTYPAIRNRGANLALTSFACMCSK